MTFNHTKAITNSINNDSFEKWGYLNYILNYEVYTRTCFLVFVHVKKKSKTSNLFIIGHYVGETVSSWFS